MRKIRTRSDEVTYETKLNIHVPVQVKVGGKATTRPNGDVKRIGNEKYGEWVTHGVEDTVVRYIVIDDGEAVDQYDEVNGWKTFTHVEARGF